jgi:small subunit ribosomal protein S14
MKKAGRSCVRSVSRSDATKPDEAEMAKKALIQKQQGKQRFKVRGYTRCQRCGRPRAVYRDFGLCRVCLRQMAHLGEIPGLTKSSW